MFSQRSRFVTEPNPLAQAMARRQASGQSLLDLTVTNPTRCGLNRQVAEQQALASLIHHDGVEYSPSAQGLSTARTALSTYLSTHTSTISPETLHLVASTSEGYSHLFRLLCNPGDTILAPQPSYPLLDHILQWDGVDIQGYPLICQQNRWKIDLQGLKNAMDSRTKAVVVIQPGNPTGAVLDQKEREELSAFCAKWDLAVISDEVFAEFYPHSSHSSFSPLPASFLGWEECLAFTLGGLSKSLGLPHFKLGWIATSGPQASEARARLDLLCDTFLSVSTPLQVALPELLALQPQLGDPIRARLRESELILQQTTQGSGIRFHGLSGGWCGLLEIPGLEDDEAFAIRLIEEAGVLVQPGYLYDFEEEHFLVVSLLTPPETLVSGMEAILARI